MPREVLVHRLHGVGPTATAVAVTVAVSRAVLVYRFACVSSHMWGPCMNVGRRPL